MSDQKTYLLFSFSEHFALGGMDDYVASFATVEAAQKWFENSCIDKCDDEEPSSKKYTLTADMARIVSAYLDDKGEIQFQTVSSIHIDDWCLHLSAEVEPNEFDNRTGKVSRFKWWNA